MGFNVGIDIGGTFTDLCSVGADGRIVTCKTPTTHYDLSVGFMRGVRELARRCGLSMPQYLERVEALRYSTTVGTNALIERTGPKLGLITTAGFEDTIFIGRGRSWADGASVHEARDMATIEKPLPLIAPDMVVGVRERLDCNGTVVMPLTREEILEKLQTLVDRGAMGFVVSTLWSFVNPVHERLIKQVIEEEYPEDYLGALPVTLSSEVSPKSGEYTRTMTAVVNAYIHGIMAQELSKLGTELRTAGYAKPVILVHNTGGTKKVSRTRAVLTHNAGPVAGMHGAARLGGLAGWRDIVFTDMGGTSFDIGVVAGGELRAQDFIPVIDRWRTNIPAIEVKSIGAGGGSIAWVNALMGGQLEVGPQSAGSMPGPACYDQGGTEPTVTDADLVLGYLNPDNYLGGDMPLDAEASERVISEKVAKPLGISTVEAAWRIRRLVDARMGQEVFNEVALKGHDPRRFVVFACGGAGATHACGFAPYIGARTVVVPAVSSVSGAFGASSMEISQVWEQSRTLKLFRYDQQAYLADLGAFNGVVESLRDQALRDLRLEGFGAERVRLRLDLDMRYGSQYNLTKVTAPKLTLDNTTDVEALCAAFTEAYSRIYSPEAAFPAGGVNVECFYLTASVVTEEAPLAPAETDGTEPPAAARLGSRPACFDPADGHRDTPVFGWTALRPGNAIDGPALIEAQDTTYVVEPGWTYRMDALRNGILERA
ncbi:hydantoinase/oxoprolinase family protein [Azospirillum sp.]|uniref:hydantoinase/oxoprolinase family protein n=1 Tax=Azospirillum sp. TaxID=34012 RepID=UPI002D4C5C2A|nr:hydantoinase/oxoprolinase family protein [Azospirillum sp.]HYD70092.1 hydantoinase/oxoprolinase family protein [Azospirillum sp.]